MTVEIQLWNASASTFLAVVDDAVSASFRDARGETGTGTVTVPLGSVYNGQSAAAMFAQDIVVMHVVDGAARFAWVVEQDTVNPLADPPTLTASGRGLLCWLEWSTIYPGRGLRRGAPKDRYFGFGASDVFTGQLGSTFGTPFLDANPAKPADWPDPFTYRIWPTPIASAPAGAEGWFYASFSTAAGQRVRIDATGDDYVRVWLDDDVIIDQDGTNVINPGVNKMTTVRKILAPGTHWIMAYGRQLRPDDMADLGISSPGDAWIAIRVATITSETDTGTSLQWTHPATWVATSVQPGWTAGFALNQMIVEAQARGVGRANLYTYSYTGDTDENGVDLPHVVNRTWPVGTDLLKFVMDLMETGVDIWVSADKKLHMAITRGTDRSTTVFLRPARNLAQYGVTRKHRVRTTALVSTGDGWTEVTDTAGAALYGRAETKLDANAVDSITQARTFATQALAPLAQPSRETDGDNTALIPFTGATPYTDFGIGDRVSVPDGLGDYTTAKVMAIAWKLGEPDTWSLELDLAQVGARRASQLPEQRVLTIAASGGAASAGGRVTSATK